VNCGTSTLELISYLFCLFCVSLLAFCLLALHFQSICLCPSALSALSLTPYLFAYPVSHSIHSPSLNLAYPILTPQIPCCINHFAQSTNLLLTLHLTTTSVSPSHLTCHLPYYCLPFLVWCYSPGCLSLPLLLSKSHLLILVSLLFSIVCCCPICSPSIPSTSIYISLMNQRKPGDITFQVTGMFPLRLT